MFGVSGVDTAYSDYRGRTLCVASKVFRVVGRSRISRRSVDPNGLRSESIRRAVKGQRGRKRRWWWWRSDWRQQRSRWSQRGRLRPAFTSQCPSKVLDAGLVERHQPGAGAHRSLHVHQVSSLSHSLRIVATRGKFGAVGQSTFEFAPLFYSSSYCLSSRQYGFSLASVCTRTGSCRSSSSVVTTPKTRIPVAQGTRMETNEGVMSRGREEEEESNHLVPY